MRRSCVKTRMFCSILAMREGIWVLFCGVLVMCISWSTTSSTVGSEGYGCSVSVEWGPRDVGRQWTAYCGPPLSWPVVVAGALWVSGAPRPWWQQDQSLPSHAGSGLGRKGGPRRLRCGRLQLPPQGGAERDRVRPSRAEPGPSRAERGRAVPRGAELRYGGPERSRDVGEQSRAWPSPVRA